MRKLIKFNEFEKLYNQGLNDTEIGAALDVSPDVVYHERKRNSLKPNFKYKNRISKESFMSLYNKGLNDREIGEVLKEDRKYIFYIRSKYNLSSNDRYSELLLTEEEEQIIIGGLLGDSTCRTNINSSISFSHSLKQEQYCLWKTDKLKRFISNSKIYSQVDKRSGEEFFCRNSYTITHPVFNQYREMFYKEGTKVITKEILNKLTTLGIAIWYMDDGYLDRPGCSLATHCFTEEEKDLIIEWFNTSYGIKWTKHKVGNIYCGADHVKQFHSLIKEFIHTNLNYKLCPD